MFNKFLFKQNFSSWQIVFLLVFVKIINYNSEKTFILYINLAQFRKIKKYGPINGIDFLQATIWRNQECSLFFWYLKPKKKPYYSCGKIMLSKYSMLGILYFCLLCCHLITSDNDVTWSLKTR